MKNKNFVYSLLAALLVLGGITASAQSSPTVSMEKIEFGDGSVFRGMSDNGLWATAYGVDAASSAYKYPKLINMLTAEVTELLTDSENEQIGECWACDVNNDGTKVVGCYDGKPAVWTKADNKWTTLKTTLTATGGHARAITGDGKYAIGDIGGQLLEEIPTMWDLETGKTVTLEGLPKVDMSGTYQGMTRLTAISEDARYIVGCVSFSYPMDILYFVYDRTNKTWDPIAFTYDAGTNKFTPVVDGAYSLSGINISPNGKWVAGTIWTTSDSEYPFRKNLETGVLETFNESDSYDKGIISIDNDGNIVSGSPSVNPYRSIYVFSGGYWYALDEVLKYHYGVNFYTKIGYDNTGTPAGYSGDGRYICAHASNTTENIIYRFDENIANACRKVNLLNTYSVSPASGVTLNSVSAITITFTRNVTALADKSQISLKDESGNVVKTAIKFATSTSNSKVIELNFRTYELEQGKKYTVEIPAGAIGVAGDETKTNDAFNIEYIGYGSGTLAVKDISPADKSDVGHLSMTTNPIVVTFDTQVKKGTVGEAYLYKNDETEPACTLNILAGTTESTANQVMIYPTATQYLYLGNTYKVVIPAGSVTDLSGFCKNDELAFTYNGTYERTIISDDTHIYIETFYGGLGNMMLYDGDQNEPNEDMKGMGFVADGTAWWRAADDDLSNMCAMSHSMYDPAGKSDDWMVTPQLYIPDEKCRLEFQAQSYKNSSTDVLKVYVYASDVVYNDLNSSDMQNFKQYSDLILEETLSPGDYEGQLNGDWQDYSYDLSAYARKKIYICFVNENENQSAIFITNVMVTHDSDFNIALRGIPESTIKATEQEVKGSIIVTNPLVTYNTVKLQLNDGEGKLIDEINADNVTINADQSYDFTFSKPLPLTIGSENIFSVYAELDGSVSSTFTSKIDNLSFKPVTRVILEEETGQACQNCPLGHLMIEKMSEIYGDNFIPLCYHTYTGDSYEYGMTDYSQYFLGLMGAPLAKIQRYATTYSPMAYIMEDGVQNYVYTGYSEPLWLDVVAEEISKARIGQVDIAVDYDQSNNAIKVDYDVTFAVSKADTNYSLFFVVTEDNLKGYQMNGFYESNDEDLGEWRSGGLYGKKVISPYIFNDVACALYPNGSYNGIAGLIPADVVDSEIYTGSLMISLGSDAPYVTDVNNVKVTCILIDGNTGEVINSARAPMGGESGGVEAIAEDNTAISITTIGKTVVVNSPAQADVLISGIDGRIIRTERINGSAAITLGYTGVAIVRVSDGKSMAVKKVIIQ